MARPFRNGWHRVGAVLLAAALGGCATTEETVDDGRKVNETLVNNIRRYGRIEQVVRPAIERSATLQDPACDKQWELPFSVASSQSWDKDDRVAWKRALGVDERLTVVAVSASALVRVGDRIVGIAGRGSRSASEMATWLGAARDEGQPFGGALADGSQVLVRPFQVCRGYTRFAPPNAPESKDYHWLMSLHPLDVADAELTEDEALWLVLWSQGLSEEGGARMKTYHYGTKVVGALYNIFTIASGLHSAALAADTVMRAAQSAAANVASDLLKQQIIAQARELAMRRINESMNESTQRLINQQSTSALQQAALNRGGLSGVARIGATVFDRADVWAFQRAPLLAANPLAGFSLHQKLVERGLINSVFVFDLERLETLTRTAEAQGQGPAVVAALNGVRPEALAQNMAGMPLATARRSFRYDDGVTDAQASGSVFAYGLIDGSLSLPLESRR